MGYQKGQGIGVKQEGIVEPIKESNQKGTHGLGYKLEHFEKRVDSWNYENDQVKKY
jgi:hypothetical protein